MHLPAWDFPGGLDSVLNQTLPLQPSQRYYIQQGSTIPTALPAALRTNWGPTASAGQEYYGPYWPDGTYSPYRPAAVRQQRDDRYYDSRLNEPRYHTYGPHYQQLPQLRKPGRLPFNLHDQARFSSHNVQSSYPNDELGAWAASSTDQSARLQSQLSRSVQATKPASADYLTRSSHLPAVYLNKTL